jgi:hypothetical protein
MPHPDAALGEIFDAERIAERLRQFLEFEHLPRIGFLVDAMEGSDGAPFQVLRHGFVGREHEFLDDAMSDIAFAAEDALHPALGVEFDDRLGQVEIDRAARVTARIEQQRQLLHAPEVLGQGLIALVHFRVALEHLVDVRVGHPFPGANDPRCEIGMCHLAACVHFHDHAHDQPVHVRIEGADAA